MGDRFPTRVGVPVKRGIARHPVSDSPEDIQGRLELMDAAGVEKQVLSPNHPPYLPDEADCVAAIRMLNDGHAELAHRYPQRIASYVMLPFPHIDAALKELERGLDQLGCVGVNMHIICLNRSVAETEFEPIYAEMNRRGASSSSIRREPASARPSLSTTAIGRRSALRSRMRPLCCT
jgi:predicted TIM-barrel fold metal-dependent hydrolase